MELVPPPSRPLRCADEENWNKLLQKVDFPFPTEFLEYGRHYGTGEIVAGYGLRIGNPLDPAYPKWIDEISQAMRTIGDPPELRKTRYYPEEHGVIPFAEDWSGNFLFMASHRKSVRVASCPGDPKDLIFYSMTPVNFLVTLFSGELDPEYFPNKELRKKTPVFQKRAWLR